LSPSPIAQLPKAKLRPWRVCTGRAGQLEFGMPKNVSAGLLLFRRSNGPLEVFLAHPGGSFWKNKDHGAWTIPKGLIDDSEEPLATAQREFEEETGHKPHGPYLPLGTIRQKAGKTVHAWAFEGDADPQKTKSNPARGGFPEIDRCEWFSAVDAKQKLNPAQAAFVDRLEMALGGGSTETGHCA
jgi:predicted NUDIX family NTP pyrophosphohydrolase